MAASLLPCGLRISPKLLKMSFIYHWVSLLHEQVQQFDPFCCLLETTFKRTLKPEFFVAIETTSKPVIKVEFVVLMYRADFNIKADLFLQLFSLRGWERMVFLISSVSLFGVSMVLKMCDTRWGQKHFQLIYHQPSFFSRFLEPFFLLSFISDSLFLFAPFLDTNAFIKGHKQTVFYFAKTYSSVDTGSCHLHMHTWVMGNKVQDIQNRLPPNSISCSIGLRSPAASPFFLSGWFTTWIPMAGTLNAFVLRDVFVLERVSSKAWKYA